MAIERSSVVAALEVDSSPVPRSTSAPTLWSAEVTDVDERPPAVPFPDRGGRSSDIILPNAFYIQDGQGRYLTVRSASQSSTLTFRSGNPDLDCAFEAIPSGTSRFRLLGRNGNQLSRKDNTANEAWYTADTVDRQYYITFYFILARGNILYLQDNNGPSRFMSSLLRSNGSPIARDFINQDSEMAITIAAVRNEILDVVYNINAAQVREAAPLVALSTSVRNDSDGDASQTLTYSYEKWAVGTWNNSAGIEVGAKTTFKAGVPFVATAEFEISVTASYEHQWGGEEGVRQTITSSTTVVVPPKKKARATIIVRNAQIDVGFSYTQRVLWSNGQSQDTKLTGIYNNVDSWHVDVALDNWEDV